MKEFKKYIKMGLIGVIIAVSIGFFISSLIKLSSKVEINKSKPTLAEQAKEVAQNVQEITSGTVEVKKLLFEAKNKVLVLSQQCDNIKKEMKKIYNLVDTPEIKSCKDLEKYEKILEGFKVEVPENQVETSIKDVKIKKENQTLKEFDKNIPEGGVVNDKNVKVIEY